MACHCGLEVLLLFVILHVLRLHAYLYYLGLNDRAMERGYTWSDGSPVTFINWHSSEPSNNFYENCIEMYQNSFQWNDLRCIEARGYICKQPLGKKRPMFLLRVPAFVFFFREQGWEYSPSTNVARVRILASTPYVGWVCCWLSALLREVFLRVLRFSPLPKNQHSTIHLERTDTVQRHLKNS